MPDTFYLYLAEFFFSLFDIRLVDAFLILNLVAHSNSFRHHRIGIDGICSHPPQTIIGRPATRETTQNARNVIVYFCRLCC